MKKIGSLLRDHPVTSYVVGAYGITWAFWIPILFGIEAGWWTLTPLVIGLLILGSFGPLVSGGVMTRLTGGSVRDWFRQALKWRVPIKWWLAALVIPVAFYGVMACVHLVMGGQLDWAEMTPLLAVPGIYLNIFLWGGGNEELGWRGFALPQLQKRHSPLVSSLMIGAVWTLWHAPAGWVEVGVVKWALDLPLYMLSVTGISLVATWLYNGSGGSVLLTMLFHAGINGAQGLYPVDGIFTPTGELARALTWVAVAFVVALLLRQRPPTAEGEQPNDAYLVASAAGGR